MRRGFTLVELLLVIAIIGVVTAVTIPELVRSIKGNQLRTAMRTVVMAGRYARSMALLNQREMLLRFDLGEKSAVSIYASTLDSGGPDEGPAPSATNAPPASGFEPDDGFETNMVAEVNTPELVRQLEGVQIVRVAIEGSDEELTEGSPLVTFQSNGSCVPYAVTLRDGEGRELRVSVDQLGTAETEDGR